MKNIIKYISFVFAILGTCVITGCTEPMPNFDKYTVTFKDYDGTILREEIIQEGHNATAPTDPQRDGYEFVGWDGIYENVQKDTVLVALYEKLKGLEYTVTFNTNCDTIIEKQIIEVNELLEEPIKLEKEGYTFIEWQLNNETFDFNTPITEDITIEALWQINQYTINFVDTDGSILFNLTQDYNTSIEIPEPPVKDYCNFIEWKQEIPSNMPAENLTIEAKWYDLREDFILDGEKIVKCISNKTKLTVPSSYYLNNELIEITKLGYASFIECANLEEVTLEEGIKVIDEAAFQWLNIKKVNLPNSIEIISNYAFTNCSSLTNINIPSNIISVEPSAFENSTNIEYYTSDNGKYLGNEENNYLVLVNLIDETVTNFEIKEETKFFLSFAFYYCNNLEYTEYENGLYLGSKTNPYKAYIKCKDSSYTTYLVHEDTEYLMDAAFYNNANIENVTLNNKIKYIGNYAFRGCTYLKSVILPEELIYLGEWAFIYCRNIEEITIPKNVTKVCESSLEACDKLKTITVDSANKYFKAVNGLLYTIDEKTLIQYALANEQEEVNVSDNVERIGMYAFMNARKIKTLNIGKNVSKIYGSAFINCSSLETINVNINNVNYKTVDGILYTSDGKTLILYPMSKNNTTFTVPSGVESIGTRAFSGNEYIQEVILPNTVQTIEGRAFYQCYNLMKINIPLSVNKIADYAFALSYNLVINCEVESQPETWASTWNQNTAQTVWGYKN